MYNSVGSTESVYLTCLDSATKRDLFCSLNWPNRISLSRSTNAKMSDKCLLVVEEGGGPYIVLSDGTRGSMS